MDPDGGEVNILKKFFFGEGAVTASLKEAKKKSIEGSSLRGNKRKRMMKRVENMQRGKESKTSKVA